MALGYWLWTAVAAPAATAVLPPAADTSLIEIVPTNNFGGAPIFNAGTTQVGTRNRGLLRFDVAAILPAGSRILSAELSLEVVGKPSDGFAAGVFELRRMLKPWGEGGRISPDPEHPGFGSPAQAGETTWTDRFTGQEAPWTEPGGLAGVDYTVDTNSEQTIYGLPDSPYVFATTARMVADVQDWLDRPTDNHGWMLLPRDESIRFTARRFASREDASQPPLLTIEFDPPMVPVFESIAIINGEVQLRIQLPAGQGCAVEAAGVLGADADWVSIRSFPAPLGSTTVTFTDPGIPGQRYYRLRFEP